VKATRERPLGELFGASLPMVVATIAGIVVLGLMVVFVDPLREAASAALHGDSAGVRESLRGLGAAGPLIVLGLCLLHAVLFYPAEIVTAATGFVYGFWPALALMMFGWMLNAWAAYAIGHSIAQPLLLRVFGEHRFRRAEEMIADGGVSLLLTVRLIPILPFSLISYAAGAARVPAWRYSWTTFVGYMPITIVAAYLGSRLETLHPTDPAVLGAVLIVILLMFGIHRLRKTMRPEPPPRESPPG
jgi:uncharacterized membrane protein YdjX (TVP38/TMEM64 family)